MTTAQAKEIVKNAPTSQDEMVKYLQALKMLAGSWAARQDFLIGDFMTKEQAEQALKNLVDSVALTQKDREAFYAAIKLLKGE